MKKNLDNISSESVLSMLYDANPIIVCEAICEIVRRKNYSSTTHDTLQEICQNKKAFWNNYLVSDFAEAALDLLGWTKYSGSRHEVRNLINSKLVFY